MSWVVTDLDVFVCSAGCSFRWDVSGSHSRNTCKASRCDECEQSWKFRVDYMTHTIQKHTTDGQMTDRKIDKYKGGLLSSETGHPLMSCCYLICSLSWLLLLVWYGQWLQTKRTSLWCHLTWPLSFDSLSNCFPHELHVNGFSPVCVGMWF